MISNYIKLIKYFRDTLHQRIHVRFSGGEPLVLGNKLFDLSQMIYDNTGIKPYILTNGELLNENILKKAKEAQVDKFIVSFENPLKMDRNSVNTYENIKKFNAFKNYNILLPGVVLITNEMFQKLSEIYDFFYTNISCLPIISEVSFKAYVSPKEQEIIDLYENTKAIVKKYFLKEPLQLFPYITPEIAYNCDYKYVLDLDPHNRFGLNPDNIEIVAERVYQKISEIYLNRFCDQRTCPWFDSCQQIRSFWEDKMEDYCSLKKAISNGFLDALATK